MTERSRRDGDAKEGGLFVGFFVDEIGVTRRGRRRLSRSSRTNEDGRSFTPMKMFRIDTHQLLLFFFIWKFSLFIGLEQFGDTIFEWEECFT